MPLKPKQQKALDTVNWFSPPNWKWNKTMRLGSIQFLRLHGVRTSKKKGVSAEEAFFLKSERGKTPPYVTNLGEFCRLLWAQRHMAMTIKMWKEGFAEGTLLMSDFVDEPEYIQRLAEDCFWNPVHRQKGV